MDWAKDEIEGKFPAINPLNYWDIQYDSKKNGVALPSYNSYDTATFDVLNKKVGIDFVLLSSVDKLKENYTNEANNPNYQTREAIVTLQLLDAQLA